MNDRKVFLGMPGYGKQTAQAGRAFWRACADMTQVSLSYQQGSLLAANFNKLWCSALNLVHCGERVDYFAMLHDDIGADDGWLDALIDELEASDLDVLGVAVPIKDSRGMTSMALHGEDNWLPYCRLSMHDVHDLPETFTSDDIGRPLLLNTGCWVCRFDIEWAKTVHFEINDRIVFNRQADRFQSQTEPEDWHFSRQLHEVGRPGSETEHLRPLRIGATRKVPVVHRGEMDFHNIKAWGTSPYDHEAVDKSPVPGAFPRDVEGWLMPDEGAKLAELAAGKRVIEVGSFCGLSTICLARTASHVAAVDYFDGRGTPKPHDTKQAFDANLKRYGVAEKVEAYHPDAELSDPPYDLLFIDGAHDRESVQADLEKYLGYLKPGGLVAFHDYGEPGHPGVSEVVDSWIGNGAKLISVTEHLAVVKPPAAIPLEI